MYSHFYINVSQNGKHLFATSPHSLNVMKSEAVKVRDEIQKRFPEDEGFKVEFTHFKGIYESVSEEVA